MAIGNRFVFTLMTLLLFSEFVEARSVRLDQTIDFFRLSSGPDNVLSGDGSSSEISITSFDYDGVFTSNPSDFSVNVFGTLYSSYYVNENGSISFGGTFDGRPGNSDPAHAGIPVFAPYFADVDSDLFGGGISHGFIPSTNLVVMSWLNMLYNGQASNDNRRVSMQIDIEDISDVTGNVGDFRLELREGGEFSGAMEWETGDLDGGVNGLGGMSALVGFWNGCGKGFQVPGSGVPGALLGDIFDCNGGSTVLACNDYVFEFRSGVPYFSDGTPVPLETSPLDSDGDGVVDADDNCTTVPNPDQRDTNEDGYGNICDADLDDSGIVNAADLGALRLVFFSDNPNADFNGDGVVNVVDLGIMKGLFFDPPGPSCATGVP